MSRNFSASRWIALSATVVSLVLTGCSPDESASLANAKARLDKRDAAGAEIELKNLLQKFPNSGEARYLLGYQLLARGDAAGAVIELERAQELRYNESLVLPALARALVSTGKSKRVIDDFAAKSVSDPIAMANLQSTVASAYAREGDLAKAKQAIDRGLLAAPDAEVALLSKAKLQSVQGDPDGALATTETAIAKHPKSDEAWSLKADLLMRKPNGQTEAIAAYRKALEVQPEQVHARAALVALQLSRGEIDAAAKDLEGLRKVAPKHFSTSFLDAQLAVIRREYPRARAILQAMLKVAPDHPLLLVTAAETEMRLGSYAQAEALAAKAMSLVPTDANARRVLAQANLRKGQPGKAVVVLAPLIERPEAPADVVALAAQANLMNGNARAAEALYARLAKLKPADPRLRTIVATSGLNRGNPEAVLSELQTIANDDTTGVSADLAIVSARLQTKQWDAALKAIESIQRKMPNKALAYQLKAQVLAQKQDIPGARQALGEALAKEPSYMPAVTALAALDLAEKQPEAAKKRFKDLLEREPKNASALMSLADLAQRTQAPQSEVVGYLQNAVDADPQDVNARMALVDHQVAIGDMRGALTAANAAVAALPDNTDLLERLARIQQRMGETDQALSTYSKITTVQPKALSGYLGQAKVYMVTGNFPQAQRAVERALEREPQNLEAMSTQVAIHVAQKRYKEALDMARSVQAARKTEAVGWQLEADIESNQAHWDTAVTALRQAITKTNPGPAPIKLHYALMKGGKPAEAETFADDWLKTHPRDLGLMFYLGDAAQATGRSELAERRYRDLLAAAPDHALAMNNLAMLLLQQKKPGALALIEKALVRMPEEPALLDTHAEALAAAGDFAKAVKAQAKAATLAPKNVAVRLKLVQLQLKAGDKAGAKTELTRITDASLTMNDTQREELRGLLGTVARQ